MFDVAGMCRRLAHPMWMREPDSWVWSRPRGGTQGFATIWRDEPGLANLMWLSMDRATPPAEYDSSINPLMSTVILQCDQLKMGGYSLATAAAVMPLQEFHDRLNRTNVQQLLKLLAKRRLSHAHS